jgi:hypothetical protein
VIDDFSFTVFLILRSVCYVGLVKTYSRIQCPASDFLFVGHLSTSGLYIGKRNVGPLGFLEFFKDGHKQSTVVLDGLFEFGVVSHEMIKEVNDFFVRKGAGGVSVYSVYDVLGTVLAYGLA